MFSKFKGALGAFRNRTKGGDKTTAFNPTPTKPPVFPDKDRFILRFACAVFAVISGKFTFNVIRDFFGMATNEDIVFAGIVAAAVTALEYSALRKAIFTHSIGYMIVSGMIAFVSILGSFGAYQGAFVKNMINSFEYQSAQRQIENLDQQIAQKQQQAAEFKTNGQMINARDRLREADQLIAQRNAAQGGLSSAREMGATGASGNAVIASLARWSDSNIEGTADTTNTALSIGVELIFLILTGLSALEEKRARRRYFTWSPQTAGGGYITATGPAPDGAGNPETAYYPAYYPGYYPHQQTGASWRPETGIYPPSPAQTTGFKIKPGFHSGGVGNGQPLPPTPSPAEPKTVTVEKVVYRDRIIEKPIESKPDMRELNRRSQARRKLNKKERRNKALELHRSDENLSISEIAQRLSVSPQTVKGYLQDSD